MRTIRDGYLVHEVERLHFRDLAAHTMCGVLVWTRPDGLRCYEALYSTTVEDYDRYGIPAGELTWFPEEVSCMGCLCSRYVRPW